MCECVRERGYQIKYLITGSFGQGNMYIGSDYGFPIFVGSSSLSEPMRNDVLFIKMTHE